MTENGGFGEERVRGRLLDAVRQIGQHLDGSGVSLRLVDWLTTRLSDLKLSQMP